MASRNKSYIDFQIKRYEYFKIERVIFNPPATIVFWQDGTKTVVKTQDEDFDPEKGLAMAISKKAMGNRYEYYNVFEEWLPTNDNNSEVFFDDTTIKEVTDVEENL